MLIKCPECGKEVSDKSEKCIHCGYPLKKQINIKCLINGKEYDLSHELDLVLNDNKIEAIRSLREKTSLGLANGKEIIDYICLNKTIPTIFNFTQPTENIPKCPTCGSPNIKKISLTSKAVGGVMFGLFSSNVRKTMHCKNCGYKW